MAVMEKRSSLDLLASVYSDSDSEEEQEKKFVKRPFGERIGKEDEPAAKKASRLPMPASLKNMFAAESAARDGPPAGDESRDHQGRVRSFAHVRGNWATHVYADVLPGTASGGGGPVADLQTALANSVAAAVPGLEVLPVESPHLSLSRVVTLRHHWIESFAGSLKAAAASSGGFPVHLGGPRVLVNEEGTRTFVGAAVEDPTGDLGRLVASVDAALAEFGLPAFWSPPAFHVSLVWALGDVSDRITSDPLLMARLEEELSSALPVAATVSEVRCKIGNKMYDFPFKHSSGVR